LSLQERIIAVLKAYYMMRISGEAAALQELAAAVHRALQ